MWIFIPEKKYAVNTDICYGIFIYEDEQNRFCLAVDIDPVSNADLVIFEGTEEECVKHLNEIMKAIAMRNEVYVLR